MAFDIKDQLKEHKKILLPGAGILLIVLIFVFMYSSGNNPFSIDTDLTGNGINNVLDNNAGSKKTYKSAPEYKLKDGADYQAIIKTEFGNITVDLFEKDTPLTVNNFVFLSQEKFYDNLTFHRIVKNFVIQGGDPKGNGSGDAGYKFADEIDAKALGLEDLKVKDATFLRYFYSNDTLNAYAEKSVSEFYTQGLGYKYTLGTGKTSFAPYVLAMANSGPATNGSQFFITTKTFTGTEYLNGKHTVFGKVTTGFDVVDSIEDVNVKSNGVPTTPVVIKSIQIVTK